MTHFACVCVGTAFGPEYVENLYKGIARNFSGEWGFTVICDGADDHRIEKLVHGRYFGQAFPDLSTPHRAKTVSSKLPLPPSWWHKLNYFRADIWPEGETVFYMDLDTIVVGDLTKLSQRKGFNMLNWGFSFYPYNSSVMIFPAGRYPFLFGEFKPGRMGDYPGDQEYTHQNLVAHGVEVHGINCDEVSSYKKHKRANGPEGESVVVFHGKPKPHELTKESWAYSKWRGL